MSDIKIRLTATPDDIEAFATMLRSPDEERFIVIEESDDYPNKGKSILVRRYITVRLIPKEKNQSC